MNLASNRPVKGGPRVQFQSKKCGLVGNPAVMATVVTLWILIWSQH
jgi:hypothetical protein